METEELPNPNLDDDLKDSLNLAWESIRDEIPKEAWKDYLKYISNWFKAELELLEEAEQNKEV